MHKVFGEKKNVKYEDRKGVYVVPIKEGKIAVVKTTKGYFLLGGGIEADELEEECIIRECLEECGYEVEVGECICSAETYGNHYSNNPYIEYFHPMQTYYLAELLKQKQLPTEKDHCLYGVPYEELRGNLFVEMQNWALDICWHSLYC